jgi:cytochrome c oxidase subunit 3/cytochrome o ubiquinol oxidase subunit 3
VFLHNAARSVRRGPPAPADPWDGRTLEWAIPSPPPPYNFAALPEVRRRDALWLTKYPDARGPGLADPAALVTPRGPIHMPPPSAWPLLTALAMLVLSAGPLVHLGVVVVGGILTVVAAVGFALEHLPARGAGAGGHAEPPGPAGVDPRKLGFWAFLGSECLFFGTLVSVYLVYKGRSLVGPYPHDAGGVPGILNIPLTSISTFDLLMSSFSMVLAVAAIERGDLRATRRWLAATIAGGLIFLGFQAWEFTEFVHKGLGLTTNLFANTFYVMVGFHGAHVSAGVLWLAALLVLAIRGRLGRPQAVLVDIAGLYWHFVDVVWIAIFTLVYLIQ